MSRISCKRCHFPSFEEEQPACFGCADGHNVAWHTPCSSKPSERPAIEPQEGPPPVTAALQELLARLLPEHARTNPANVRVSVLGPGIELPVHVLGLGRLLLQVSHAPADEARFVAPERLVLRVVLGDGAIRVDVPVEVASSGRLSTVLRILAAPLVLRRRVVRDQALEEALGVREPSDSQPLVA